MWPNTSDAVTYQSKGFIGAITLNRPLKRNALNTNVWDALNQAVLMAVQGAKEVGLLF
ncbi:MAG: hypothetical protein J7M20_00060 [Deltaproteobacteria bacterium]|nr:hypothetical protein [Deltaproteobacteria bacterium]